MNFVSVEVRTQEAESIEIIRQIPSLVSISEKIETLEAIIRSIRQSGVYEKQNSDHFDFAAKASQQYRSRRKIDQIFGLKGFSQSPAWDIMLDLFVSEARGARISVTSACIGAGCPGTTGLRWLSTLESMGFLMRSDDPSDKRRAIVSLSRDGLAKTRKALEVGWTPRRTLAV